MKKIEALKMKTFEEGKKDPCLYCPYTRDGDGCGFEEKENECPRYCDCMNTQCNGRKDEEIHEIIMKQDNAQYIGDPLPGKETYIGDPLPLIEINPLPVNTFRIPTDCSIITKMTTEQTVIRLLEEINDKLSKIIEKLT